jgi:hypothetical protein
MELATRTHLGFSECQEGNKIPAKARMAWGRPLSGVLFENPNSEINECMLAHSCGFRTAKLESFACLSHDGRAKKKEVPHQLFIAMASAARHKQLV